MSASTHLAGLYPPVGRQVWNPSLNWQPIPIHTTRVKDDPILAFDKPCPKIQQLIDDLTQNGVFNFLEQYKDIFEILSTNSGENVTTLYDLSLITDTLYIEKLYNLTLPKWAEDIYPSLEFLSKISAIVPTCTPDLARLRTGKLYYFSYVFFYCYHFSIDTNTVYVSHSS